MEMVITGTDSSTKVIGPHPWQMRQSAWGADDSDSWLATSLGQPSGQTIGSMVVSPTTVATSRSARIARTRR